MRLSKGCWLVLLLAAEVCARDPFHPMLSSRCEAPVVSLTEWRLQGILGKEKDFLAWLITPQGKVIRVGREQRFPLPDWKISRITRYSLALTPAQSCLDNTFIFQLKGNPYAEDSATVRRAVHNITASRE